MIVSCSPEVAQEHEIPKLQTQQEEIVFAKEEAWVKRALIPKPIGDDFVGGYETLLIDRQNYYGSKSQQSYIEIVSYVHDPSGLTAVGNLSVQWDPSRATLYIHRVTIRRGKRKIDVLADGQEFSVFQRERNLEAAFVDGIKTAALQIQGLVVGDVVNFSYSIHTKIPVITKTTSDLTIQLASDAQTVRLRQVWPKHRKMKWEASPEMPAPQIRETKKYHELIFDLSGLKKKQVGISAPYRFYLTEALAISDISSWSQISAEYERLKFGMALNFIWKLKKLRNQLFMMMQEQ